jgi:hypothetical protein
VLHPEDDVNRGAHPVAVISYAFWQRRFGGDAGTVGSRVKLNGLDYTVVGITPEQFIGAELVFTPEMWVPMAMEPQIEPRNNDLDKRCNLNYFVTGRLKHGLTMPQAEAALNAVAGQLATGDPDANQRLRIHLSPPGLFGNFLRGAIRASLRF